MLTKNVPPCADDYNRPTLAKCGDCSIEHAYFADGSALKFYVEKDSLRGSDKDATFYTPIYAHDKLAGWILAKCLDVVKSRVAFQAVELFGADFRVPSGSRILILA